MFHRGERIKKEKKKKEGEKKPVGTFETNKKKKSRQEKKKRKKKWRKKEKRNDRDPMRMQLIVRQFRSIKTIKIDLFDTPALAKKKKKRNKLANQRGEGGRGVT